MDISKSFKIKLEDILWWISSLAIHTTDNENIMLSRKGVWRTNTIKEVTDIKFGWWWWMDDGDGWIFPLRIYSYFVVILISLLTFFCRPFVSLMEGLDWLKVIKNIKKCTSSAYWSNETWEYQCVNERSLWKRNTFPCVNLLPGCFPDGEYFVLLK